ncbi:MULTISPECIES: polysaccharide deacetylase family protein [Pseudobutyrivibrio]|nr:MULTISPECIES: polysaccharide deacetylase family protein [Pseudobutyrivibrio]SCX86274.1 Peptidoglycan/xylan/chitin deacetylase, PgdA/CDA1 family [Pseudobutyrivibrio sp. AR14]
MEGSNMGLERQRAKRKRVARMKKMIVTTIIAFMLITLCVLTFLCIEVISLQKQVDVLSAKVNGVTDVYTEAAMSDEEIEDSIYVVDNSENFAETGDIPLVYLTFDDGPSENTEQILDILDDYNVKATFFVNGKEDEASANTYRRIVDEGHTIGMHGYIHDYSTLYQSTESFSSDYDRIHQLILDTTGVDTHFYRFPGGSSNTFHTTSMCDLIGVLNDKGAVYYDWNVQAGDATISAFTEDDLIDNVMNNVVQYKTSVVLLHEKDVTVESLPRLIESLQQAGVMILPITDDTYVIHHVNVK